MKTSFVSTLSVHAAMRDSIASVQLDMAKALKENTSGKHADIGVTLGAATSLALDLSRDISRLESLATTAGLATSRLESAELALESINDAGLEIQSAILTLGQSTDASSLATARSAVTSALQTFTNAANTSFKGEYIFAGVNSDVRPLEDYFASDSPAKAAFDAELNYFLSENGIGSREAMTKAEMTAFLDDIEAKFLGQTALTSPPHAAEAAGQDLWTTFFSSASDQNIKSRIGPGELVESSTNANGAGMRNFAFASIIAIEFLTPEMDQDARELAAARTTSAIATAMNGDGSINHQRTVIGINTERVSRATERMLAQKDILTTSLGNLENIDAEEAAIRLNTLQTLLETAYAVTARIQQLSLVNYL